MSFSDWCYVVYGVAGVACGAWSLWKQHRDSGKDNPIIYYDDGRSPHHRRR